MTDKPLSNDQLESMYGSMSKKDLYNAIVEPKHKPLTFPMTMKQIEACGHGVEKRGDNYYIAGTTHEVTVIPSSIQPPTRYKYGEYTVLNDKIKNPFLTNTDRQRLQELKEVNQHDDAVDHLRYAIPPSPDENPIDGWKYK
jgi:hypothetical protein